MRFEFLTASHVIFGPGTLKEAGKVAKEWGRKAFVITGANPARAAALLSVLHESHISTHELAVHGEPTVSLIIDGVNQARKWGADMVIGIGGGSVIDAAKAIAGLVPNEHPVEVYLEVIGKGVALELPALPWMAIPTTAGTGAEVTRNAVLSVPSHKVKVSLRSVHLLAAVALVDPELAVGMSAELTAATGLDALCQLIEPYVSSRANPLTDALCEPGIQKVVRALPLAFENPTLLEARTDLALGALWSGMALTNSGLGAVHGLAAPLGGLLGAPHGALCGAMLAPVTRGNIAALQERGLDCSRYDQVARWLTGNPAAKAADGADFLAALTQRLGIARLASHGLTEDLIPVVVEKSLQASSMKANPVALREDELAAMLRASL